MKLRPILDQSVRVVVGVVFIFSGLMKLDDPIGTAIKMEEYFSVFAKDFGSFFKIFVPGALEISFLLIILEIILGVAVLLFYRMRWTSIALLCLIVFFTFLTFYSAAFDKVTDCGCFGDAIKLTPWESFIKDCVLLILILHLFWYRRQFKPAFSERAGLTIVAIATALCTYLGIHAIRHLPFIDFRPYKIGNNIPEQMKPEEQPKIEYVFEKDGEKVHSEKFLPETEGYKYVESHVLNPDKVVPKITDYAVSDTEGKDYTDSTFTGTRLLIIIYDVSLADTGDLDDLRALTQALDGKVSMMVLTASSEADFEAFRHRYQLAVPYYFADATVLKTIIRSNPGLTLWKNGNVLAKWHHNDIPSAADVLKLVRQ